MTTILGINFFSHDTAACLLDNGEPVVLVEQERLNRDQHTKELPDAAIDSCLRFAGIGASDLDAVAVAQRPLVDLARGAGDAVGRAAPKRLAAQVYTDTRLVGRVARFRRRWAYRGPLYSVGHHDAHAGGAFYPSGFDEAAVLTIDRGGDFLSTTLGRGSGTRLATLGAVANPHSLGELYTAVTVHLGFRPGSDEGKVMGLAPYGTPALVPAMRELVELRPGGGFRIDLSRFGWAREGAPVSARFFDRFGPARPTGVGTDPAPQGPGLRRAGGARGGGGARRPIPALPHRPAPPVCLRRGGAQLGDEPPARDRHRLRRDLRPAGRVRRRQRPRCRPMGVAQPARRRTRLGHGARPTGAGPVAQCVGAGGSAVQGPPAGIPPLRGRGRRGGPPAGRWKGGRLVPWSRRGRTARPGRPVHPGRPPGTGGARHRQPPGEAPGVVPAVRPECPGRARRRVVRRLRPQPLHAPGATGATRPAAPGAGGDPCGRHGAAADRHPGCQPLYHRLISQFHRATGVPMVLNTSFNLRGEPIVHTAAQALDDYVRSGMDAVVIGDFIAEKVPPPTAEPAQRAGTAS